MARMPPAISSPDDLFDVVEKCAADDRDDAARVDRLPGVGDAVDAVMRP